MLFDRPLAALLAAELPEVEPAEPWLDEATAILRSLPPQALAIVFGMLRAASATAGREVTGDDPFAALQKKARAKYGSGIRKLDVKRRGRR